MTVCDDGIESRGGYGGGGGIETGGDGISGLPEPVGNPPERGVVGSGASSMPCTDGQNGANGADTERAAGAAGAGLLDVDGWVGVRGADGEKGGVGQGGGGGGGGKGRDDMTACPAGRSQGGAAGGDAGGGLGGHSLGIGSVGASVAILEHATVLPGQAGKGGLGGNAAQESGDGQGEEGIALFWYRFEAPASEQPL
ncbi:hypothetical protein WME99_00440 [Sorangium sp. So ce136]|uniref:hypothetical protein n=1 Tax=Sorangium sp. So ce136 TaxID=3133284 RepID=UPI003F0FA3B9